MVLVDTSVWIEFFRRRRPLDLEALVELDERIRWRAQRQHRSVAQEVTHILRQALEEPESLSILELRGLGKETWGDIEPTQHVDTERRSWD